METLIAPLTNPRPLSKRPLPFYPDLLRIHPSLPSAPKLDDQRILKDLAGAIGALSNAKERVETPTAGLKWGCRTLV